VAIGTISNAEAGSSVRNKLNSVISRANVVIDAGTTQDLTAVISEAVAAGACTVRLRSGIEYDWPAGVDLPQGMNMVGDGWDMLPDPGFNPAVGAVINSTGRVIQATGATIASVIQGVFFTGGLHLRKQHTTLIGCRTAGLGLQFGHNVDATSPYYINVIGHHFHAAEGEACITLLGGTNAIYVQGAMFLSVNGRGLYFDGVAVGNKFILSYDVADVGEDVGSAVYFNSASHENDIQFIYWEGVSTKKRDGAHVIFDGGPYDNTVRIEAQSEIQVKNVNGAGNRVVTLRTNGSKVRGADFEWAYSYPDNVMMTAGNDVYIPPTTLRWGALKLAALANPTTAHAPHFVTAAAVNAAGSGGTNGTYYQEISDANTVSGHPALVQITVAGGVMTAATLKYRGWFKAAPSTSFAVTAVTGLTGGTLTLTVGTNPIDNGTENSSVTTTDGVVNTFIADDANASWRVFPQ
jgi:hypothetical protein